jgi:hypothetical protein
MAATLAIVYYAACGTTSTSAQQNDGVLLAQLDAGEEASQTETAELVEDPDGDQQRAELPSPERRERLQRRAGEKTLRGPQGRAVVLGMHIQETDGERAKVIDVAPSSAAFDAGVRKGDEIISFDGFTAEAYREWIDGMRRLTRDVPDGKSLPIVIDRAGARLDLRLRVPIAVAGGLPPNDVLATEQQQVVPGLPGQTNVIMPGQANRPIGVGGGGDNVLIADAFGDDFNINGGETEAAIAEIFSLNRPVRKPPVGNRTSPVREAERNRAAVASRETTSPSGQRIGLAGFRNDANGLFVMVDVGGLEPGNYLVGIDDPGVLNTNPVDDTDTPVPQTPNRVRSGQVAPGNRAVEPQQQINRPRTPASGAAPADASGRSQPQSRLEPPVLRQLPMPRTVLAQVADPANNDVGVNPTPVEGIGRETPLDPPATQLDTSGTAARDVPRTADARRDPSLTRDAGNVLGGTAMTHQIGTLTVDQSGTGRLQQTVEGVQVKDIVGQAIVLYSSNPSENTPLPPNLDAAADPNAVPRSTPAGRARGAAIQNSPQATTPNRNVATATGSFGGQIPVAGGLIRLMSDGSATPPTTPQDQPTTVPLEGGQSIQVDAPSVPAPGATD